MSEKSRGSLHIEIRNRSGAFTKISQHKPYTIYSEPPPPSPRPIYYTTVQEIPIFMAVHTCPAYSGPRPAGSGNPANPSICKKQQLFATWWRSSKGRPRHVKNKQRSGWPMQASLSPPPRRTIYDKSNGDSGMVPPPLPPSPAHLPQRILARFQIRLQALPRYKKTVFTIYDTSPYVTYPKSMENTCAGFPSRL